MDPNDRPGDPFAPQPIRDMAEFHVCRDGRCVVMVHGGRLDPESLRALEEFLDRHRPEGRA